MKMIIGLLLAVFTTSSAMALSIDVVDCKAGNGYVLNLVRVNDTLIGRLQDAYNGADIQCEQGAWGAMTYTKEAITCVGIWDQAYDRYGKPAERQVEIELSMDSSSLNFVGKAKYERNWDERSAFYNTYIGYLFPKRTLTCDLGF